MHVDRAPAAAFGAGAGVDSVQLLFNGVGWQTGSQANQAAFLQTAGITEAQVSIRFSPEEDR